MTHYHTLREILQQPQTWMDTARLAGTRESMLRQCVDGAEVIVVTGSGSSEYAGHCVLRSLQDALKIPVVAIPGGEIVMHGSDALPPHRRGLLISLGRSGNSPESCAAIRRVKKDLPDWKHLVITCNAAGELATRFAEHALVLDERTNDKSLVMTSCFTNLVVAALALAFPGQMDTYSETIAHLSTASEKILRCSEPLRDIARGTFDRAVFLGSGARLGAAREASLKMLEMTAGRIVTFAETFLGVRHGPMAAMSEQTLVVCFLSSHPKRRAFEADLLTEISRKRLSSATVIRGTGIGSELGGFTVDCGSLNGVPDDQTAVLDVVLGQLLAYHRCMREGLDPDSPSATGVITRVVDSFPLHGVDA